MKSTTPVTRIVWDCQHFWYRPRTVYTCGDGSVYFTGISYKTYTHGHAMGSAVLHANDCIPYCAVGTFHSYKATFTFYHVQQYKGRPTFKLASVYYGRHHFVTAIGI